MTSTMIVMYLRGDDDDDDDEDDDVGLHYSAATEESRHDVGVSRDIHVCSCYYSSLILFIVICVCCLASDGTNLSETMMYGG